MREIAYLLFEYGFEGILLPDETLFAETPALKVDAQGNWLDNCYIGLTSKQNVLFAKQAPLTDLKKVKEEAPIHMWRILPQGAGKFFIHNQEKFEIGLQLSGSTEYYRLKYLSQREFRMWIKWLKDEWKQVPQVADRKATSISSSDSEVKPIEAVDFKVHCTSDLRKLARNVRFTHIDPMLFAIELTLLDRQMLLKVPQTELDNYAWASKNHEDFAPNIVQLVQLDLHITLLFQNIILRANLLEERAKNIKHTLSIAYSLRLLKNYNSMRAIAAALDSTSIFRLKATWDFVKFKYPQQYEFFIYLFKLFSHSMEWSAYKAHLQKGMEKPPCIPFVGYLLQKMISVRNNSFLHDGFIHRVQTRIDHKDQMIVKEMTGDVKRIQKNINDHLAWKKKKEMKKKNKNENNMNINNSCIFEIFDKPNHLSLSFEFFMDQQPNFQLTYAWTILAESIKHYWEERRMENLELFNLFSKKRQNFIKREVENEKNIFQDDNDFDETKSDYISDVTTSFGDYVESSVSYSSLQNSSFYFASSTTSYCVNRNNSNVNQNNSNYRKFRDGKFMERLTNRSRHPFWKRFKIRNNRDKTETQLLTKTESISEMSPISPHSHFEPLLEPSSTVVPPYLNHRIKRNNFGIIEEQCIKVSGMGSNMKDNKTLNDISDDIIDCEDGEFKPPATLDDELRKEFERLYQKENNYQAPKYHPKTKSSCSSIEKNEIVLVNSKSFEEVEKPVLPEINNHNGNNELSDTTTTTSTTSTSSKTMPACMKFEGNNLEFPGNNQQVEQKDPSMIDDADGPPATPQKITGSVHSISSSSPTTITGKIMNFISKNTYFPSSEKLGTSFSQLRKSWKLCPNGRKIGGKKSISQTTQVNDGMIVEDIKKEGGLGFSLHHDSPSLTEHPSTYSYSYYSYSNYEQNGKQPSMGNLRNRPTLMNFNKHNKTRNNNNCSKRKNKNNNHVLSNDTQTTEEMQNKKIGHGINAGKEHQQLAIPNISLDKQNDNTSQAQDNFFSLIVGEIDKSQTNSLEVTEEAIPFNLEDIDIFELEKGESQYELLGKDNNSLKKEVKRLLKSNTLPNTEGESNPKDKQRKTEYQKKNLNLKDFNNNNNNRNKKNNYNKNNNNNNNWSESSVELSYSDYSLPSTVSELSCKFIESFDEDEIDSNEKNLVINQMFTEQEKSLLENFQLPVEFPQFPIWSAVIPYLFNRYFDAEFTKEKVPNYKNKRKKIVESPIHLQQLRQLIYNRREGALLRSTKLNVKNYCDEDEMEINAIRLFGHYHGRLLETHLAENESNNNENKIILPLTEWYVSQQNFLNNSMSDEYRRKKWDEINSEQRPKSFRPGLEHFHEVLNGNNNNIKNKDVGMAIAENVNEQDEVIRRGKFELVKYQEAAYQYKLNPNHLIRNYILCSDLQDDDKLFLLSTDYE
ncbi:hypothetical protein SNEBB_002387 [Seison nebaliae]|nr:hypothetical protein SNEBB_002387 [Seison nebaliae]